jgi:hypothetical protein
MCIIGTDEMHFVADHPLKAHPDIGLDVLHDVADMKRAIGVRQCSGNEQMARRGHEGGSVA